MRRYEGFLRRTEDSPTWPGRWWIVAVELAQHALSVPEQTRRSGLMCWAGLVLDCDGPRVVSRSELRGTTAGEFWDVFTAQQQIKGSIYVISPRALMAWQVLGMWERIECGTVRLQALGAPVVSGIVDRPTSGEAGLLLTADPPTAGRFIHAESQMSFSWTCAQNYGLQSLSAGNDCVGEAHELELRIRSASTVLDTYRLGGWGITAGSMALRGWRASYDGRPIYCSSGRTGDTLESSAVAGGLLLARPTGEEPVTAVSVDARSMYPYICAHYPQATDLRRRHGGAVEATKAARQCPELVLCRCELQTDKPYYPQRTDAGVIYPVGRFVTTLCGPELVEAQKRGHVLNVLCANEYEVGLPTATYQRRVWAAREACEEGEARWAAPLVKRLGVALVGKLSQRCELWRECLPDITDPLWGQWDCYEWDGRCRKYMARAGITEVMVGSELASHAIPSIPLWVWSWGRVRLWRWLETCGLDTVYYADTDGMLLSTEGFARLQAQNVLANSSWGLLRHVSGPSPCVVRGPKNFALGDRVVCAGWPLNQRQNGSQIGESA